MLVTLGKEVIKIVEYCRCLYCEEEYDINSMNRRECCPDNDDCTDFQYLCKWCVDEYDDNH